MRGQVTLFKPDVGQLIPHPLPIFQHAMYAAMFQALQVQHVNVTLGHIEMFQQLPGLDAEVAAQDETGCVATVETVETPALVAGLEATATSAFLAYRAVEADPARGRGFASRRQVTKDI
jgi:hypothetical protein